MHTSAIAAVIVTLLAGAHSGPIAKRTDLASTVESDLSAVSSQLNTVLTAVTNYDGSLVESLQIQSEQTTLENDVTQATTDTNSSDDFTSAESTTITNDLLALVPTIIDTLSEIVDQKTAFTNAGVASLVLSDLQTLQSDTDALSSALQGKVTSTDAQTVASGTAEVDAAFSSAIAAYS